MGYIEMLRAAAVRAGDPVVRYLSRGQRRRKRLAEGSVSQPLSVVCLCCRQRACTTHVPRAAAAWKKKMENILF